MPSYALNNFTAPDIYLAAGATALNGLGVLCGPATLQFLPVVDHFTVDVSNAAVYWSLMETDRLAGPNTGRWQPETFLLPGSKVIARAFMTGIRIRAAVPALSLPAGGQQAQVTVEAVQ